MHRRFNEAIQIRTENAWRVYVSEWCTKYDHASPNPFLFVLFFVFFFCCFVAYKSVMWLLRLHSFPKQKSNFFLIVFQSCCLPECLCAWYSCILRAIVLSVGRPTHSNMACKFAFNYKLIARMDNVGLSCTYKLENRWHIQNGAPSSLHARTWSISLNTGALDRNWVHFRWNWENV